MFRGSLDPDVTFLGFALSEEAALGIDPAGPGWFFVFEQHPGEPRFGLDEEADVGTPATPDDLAWPHVPLTASGHIDVEQAAAGAGGGTPGGLGQRRRHPGLADPATTVPDGDPRGGVAAAGRTPE